MRRRRALLAGLLAMFLGSAAAVAAASPLLTLQIEGSLTGAPGTYSSSLVISEQPSQTIYYEVNAIFSDGAANSNTANSPNGTSDSIDSLPSFQLTAGSGWTLSNATMRNGFGVGSGAGVTQPNGANTAVVRAVNSPGVYLNADSPLTIVTGELTAGTLSGLQPIFGAYYANSGLTKVSGSLTSITSTTETSADPIMGYSPLLVSAPIPEPASLGIFGIAAVGLLRRRRQSAGLAGYAIERERKGLRPRLASHVGALACFESRLGRYGWALRTRLPENVLGVSPPTRAGYYARTSEGWPYVRTITSQPIPGACRWSPYRH